MLAPSTQFGQTIGNGSMSRVDQIAADLQRQIADGQLRVGHRLPSERSLCTTFGVGRTTVREALKSLLVQGVVERGRRGVTVADVQRQHDDEALAAIAARATVRDLYDVRKLIDVRVARWSALRATQADVERLRHIVQAEGLESETVEGHHSHAALHDALVQVAANPVLLQVYESSRELFFRLPYIWQLLDATEIHNVRAHRHAMAHSWHRRLLAAIESRDADEAEGAMFQHLDEMEKDLLSRLLVRPNLS
jgi:DNA-binding FadR family transcriptional regulator